MAAERTTVIHSGTIGLRRLLIALDSTVDYLFELRHQLVALKIARSSRVGTRSMEVVGSWNFGHGQLRQRVVTLCRGPEARISNFFLVADQAQ